MKNNKLIQWWVTPKLPIEDIWAPHSFVSKWIAHPIKRRVARLYLKFLQRFFGIKVIGITGSSGKTTTTQMLASILKLKGKTVWSREGVDSVYNIPNMILRCSWNTKYLILEMSVEYIGEMDFYLWLAKPNIAVVTNVFPAHTLYLGDEKGIASEKSKIIRNFSIDDIAVLNQANKFTKEMAEQTKGRVVWFGKKDHPLMQNSEAAAKVAETLGIDKNTIKAGLMNYEKPKHRFNTFKHNSGAFIFDDSYNSNPEAVISTIKTFVKLAKNKKKIAILGDMLELGGIEESEHRRVGKKIRELNFDAVIGVGKLAKFIVSELDEEVTKIWLVEKSDEVLPILLPLLNKQASVFIKGSRSLRLDKVVSALL